MSLVRDGFNDELRSLPSVSHIEPSPILISQLTLTLTCAFCHLHHPLESHDYAANQSLAKGPSILFSAERAHFPSIFLTDLSLLPRESIGMAGV